MRARVSPNLRRRPLHDELTRFHEVSAESAHRSPNGFSDKDLEEDSDDEITDILKVDDVDEGTGQMKGLYPDISELEREDARFVMKTDRHGTFTAGQYTKTTIKAKHETSMPTESQSFCFKIGLPIFIVLMMLAFVMVFGVNPNGGPVKSAPLRVSEIVNKLKQEYVNQPSLSFRIIKKALERVISLKNHSEPLAPAVLLIMSTKGAEDETASFAEELAALVASGNTNYQTIYGDRLQNENPDKAKKEIDDLIKGAPRYDNRQIVILIRDLDVIPPKAVMMLHAYCDHENAPFKNAVFIMTINTDADLNNCETKQFDEAAESHLTRVWGDLGKDMLSPLLSRITVSVAAIYHKTKPSFCR